MSEGAADNLRSDMNEASFVRLAEAHRREGLVEDAIRICREGLARRPESLRGRMVLGQCLLDQGAIGEAIVELGRVERESGGDPTILALLCEVRLAGPQRRPVNADAAPSVAAGDADLVRPRDAEDAGEVPTETPVLILDEPGDPAAGGDAAQAASADPLASSTLADLYASQGDRDTAATILRHIAPEEPRASEDTPQKAEPESVPYLAELTRLRQVAERLRKAHAQ